MKLKSLVCAIALLGTAGLAQAADSYSLAASGVINGVCKFTQAAGGTLVFSNNLGGGIDPSVATNATASANITYKCTNGTAPATTTGAGANDAGGNHLLISGANSMIYTVGFTGGGAGDGFGAGSTNKTLAVAGTIAQAQFTSAVAGTYTDTLTVNITP